MTVFKSLMTFMTLMTWHDLFWSNLLINDLIAFSCSFCVTFAWCMTKYRVEITETLSRTIEMEAESVYAAVEKVRQMYQNCEIILDSSDYVETEISVKRWKKRRVLEVFRDNSLTLHPLIAHYERWQTLRN